ncbi:MULTISPECIES: cytochrome oxidase putative small subunit CydP [Pseudomonas]|uniref:cytochrome oxidase putative small subunit CydP n=1 Tax=Pseudomonas TaxID=286 RepID=UPI0008637A22|nr:MULTISPECIES: cytochrome oxidase putative small subunit CydP [Pseudomonas]ATR82813.1 hypothetical protein CS390_09720 [Pseudomonas sp. HLS-6]MBA1319767.1 hypothetical protein [Pseudomonas monteilii]MCD9092821.1 hypothetical protein [Pseudomonas sp. CP-1]MCF1251188.1 hypothetical protein [Pseudomonas putida]MCO7504850.1 hypothetical protein [Pseudomonas sp. VE 267-6A]
MLTRQGLPHLPEITAKPLFLKDKKVKQPLGMPCAYWQVMTIFDKRLRRHLLTAVVIKLLVLTVLWWLFIRDSHVSVDPNIIGNRFGVPTLTQGASK